MIEHFANYMLRNYDEITLQLIEQKLKVSRQIAWRVYHLVKKKVTDAKRIQTRKHNELVARAKTEASNLPKMQARA